MAAIIVLKPNWKWAHASNTRVVAKDAVTSIQTGPSCQYAGLCSSAFQRPLFFRASQLALTKAAGGGRQGQQAFGGMCRGCAIIMKEKTVCVFHK
jgi:hypothetical protein